MKKGQAGAVAKPAKPAKPVVVHHQHLTAAQHHKAVVAAHKAAATRKHNLALAKKHAGTRKHAARGWSPDEDVAICSARAVAESLRLALGVVLADGDVLALHRAAGGDDERGAAILDVLRAVPDWPGTDAGSRTWFSPVLETGRLSVGSSAALILGLDLPGGEPHAVAVAPDGAWWSWGEPYSPSDFPGAVIEEAWAVRWR